MNVETTNEITTTEIPPNDASGRALEAAEHEANVARSVRWFRPPVDVFESADAFRVDFDMPGVSADRVELTVDGRMLVVEALRDDARGWRRELRLTDGIDLERVDATMEAGVLRLVLPKAEAAKQRRITVRGR
jgi:HSP20 family molecular chaperone IbpA